MLMRADPDYNWSAEELSAVLRGAVPLAREILESFARAHILQRQPDGAYRHAPDPQTAAIINELAKLNASFPLAVAKEILLAPNDKIQIFVDAFKLK
jgi:hypothetical protein